MGGGGWDGVVMLFPTAYPFPLSYLGVIDSNFLYIHINLYLTSQNEKKIKKFSKMTEKSNF